MESPEERERRLAVARERTRLGRSMETAEQKKLRRLRKSQHRIRERKQVETAAESVGVFELGEDFNVEGEAII